MKLKLKLWKFNKMLKSERNNLNNFLSLRKWSVAEIESVKVTSTTKAIIKLKKLFK